MNPHFGALVVLDALKSAGVLDKQQHQRAIDYVDSIPGYLDFEEYKRWHDEQ